MLAVNGKRIVAGGLLAGLVLNVGHGVGEVVLAPQFESLFDRLGLSAPTEAGMMLVVGAAFVIGIVAVWLYASIRPRYGAGARTALAAGIVVWFLVCLIPNTTLLVYGILTPRLFWMASLVDLLYVPAAVLAGARVYREEGASAIVAARAMAAR